MSWSTSAPSRYIHPPPPPLSTHTGQPHSLPLSPPTLASLTLSIPLSPHPHWPASLSRSLSLSIHRATTSMTMCSTSTMPRPRRPQAATQRQRRYFSSSTLRPSAMTTSTSAGSPDAVRHYILARYPVTLPPSSLPPSLPPSFPVQS